MKEKIALTLYFLSLVFAEAAILIIYFLYKDSLGTVCITTVSIVILFIMISVIYIINNYSEGKT